MSHNLDNAEEIYNSVEIKSKGKKALKKTADYLFQKAIKQLSSELFYEHKQISDEEVKKQLKDKLKNDKDCAEQLQYLKEKRFLFDKLWNKKFYSDVSIEDSKKVYEELYNPSDPNNPNSDTFLALIIKYAFISEDEHTYANTIWTQTVLELIFNENYLLAKLDSDINKKDACVSSANSQVESLDLIDINDHYENLSNFDSESHLSDNSIEDNDSNDNYNP
ncbi:13116_t:CDS:2, partial [Racocetra persica]